MYQWKKNIENGFVWAAVSHLCNKTSLIGKYRMIKFCELV